MFAVGRAENARLIPNTGNNRETLIIVFTWPGDDMASRQELDIRDRIARRIAALGIGDIIRAGTGMGWMEPVVGVEDKQAARRMIEEVVNDLWPGARIRIQENRYGRLMTFSPGSAVRW